MGAPSYTGSFLFNHLRRSREQATPAAGQGTQQNVQANSQMHLRKETSIADSRRALFDGKVSAWEKEMDSLELAISKVREHPTLEGVKFLRERKAELGKKNITTPGGRVVSQP